MMKRVLCVVQAKLWQCFLESATNRLRHQHAHGNGDDLTGIDAAKLVCCFRATTARCRQLCQQVINIIIGFLCIIYVLHTRSLYGMT